MTNLKVEISGTPALHLALHENPPPDEIQIISRESEDRRAIDAQTIVVLVLGIPGSIAARLIGDWLQRIFSDGGAKTVKINGRRTSEFNDAGHLTKVIEEITYSEDK